jgi:hypothetical protein
MANVPSDEEELEHEGCMHFDDMTGYCTKKGILCEQKCGDFEQY